MNLKYNLLGLLIFCSVLISACSTPVSEEDWPSTLPDRNLFVNSWQLQKEAGHNDNSLDNHLLWIHRFYKGSILFATGWNDMIEIVLSSLDTAAEKEEMQNRLDDLGIDIVTEWAQNNESRNITSSTISVWGNGIRTAIENSEQFQYLDLIEKDAAALISGDLDAKVISRERYYPSEDFNDF